MKKPLQLIRWLTTLGASFLSLTAFANSYFDANLPHHTQRAAPGKRRPNYNP